jgi:rhodanese-related sulfurtransferase
MYLIAICVVGIAVFIFGTIRWKKVRDKQQLEAHSIEPEDLYSLLKKNDESVLLFDVRQPLDLLAHSEIIPGSTRIPPKDVLDQASLIPREKDAVIYCTCESEKTSRMILRRALALEFSRIKFLRGGLAAWKAKGLPVEPYTKPFHLDTGV